MNTLRIIALVAVALILLVVGALVYFEHFANPRVARELIDDPTGKRAQRVMLVTLPSGSGRWSTFCSLLPRQPRRTAIRYSPSSRRRATPS